MNTYLECIPCFFRQIMEGAIFCGIDKMARVISNGADAPGTILSLCSKRFTEEQI